MLEFWPVAAILSMTTLVLSSLYIVLSEPDMKLSSVSRYISQKTSLYIYMGLLLTFGGALGLSGFIIFWLTPTYDLPSVTIFLAITAYIALLGLAWIPDIDRSKGLSLHVIHFACGGIVAVCLIGCLVTCLTRPLGPVSFFTTSLAVLFCSLNIVLYFMTRFVKKYFLEFEVISVMLLFAAFFCLIFRV